jgi:hypothetical protein
MNKLPTWFVSSVTSVVVALSVSWWMTYQHLSTFSATIPPPVIIASYPKLNEKFFAGIPQNIMSQAYDLLNSDIEKYKEMGFIVLDGRSVLDAPDHMFMSVPDIEYIEDIPGYDNDKTAKE